MKMDSSSFKLVYINLQWPVLGYTINDSNNTRLEYTLSVNESLIEVRIRRSFSFDKYDYLYYLLRNQEIWSTNLEVMR